MGTDIHAFIEYRFGDNVNPPWLPFQEGELSLGRCYALFKALAGVRKHVGDPDELIPARGFPDDASSECFLAIHVPIFDNPPVEDDVFHDWPYVLRSRVTSEFTVVKYRNEDYVREGDGHHHSYLSLTEIYRCLEHSNLLISETDIWFQAAVAAMSTIETLFETRLVFWFDN